MVVGGAPIVGSGENLRSMAYVDNLAQGILLAVIRPRRPDKPTGSPMAALHDERNLDTIERLLERSSIFRGAQAHAAAGFGQRRSRTGRRRLAGGGLYNQKIHVLSEMNKTIACSIQKAELSWATGRRCRSKKACGGASNGCWSAEVI